jgi:SAM-dependent methyltransferase
MTERQAAEHLDLEEAEARLAESREWMISVLARLGPMLPPKGPLDVLEVGCAQGRSLIALGELGHRAVGIDPEESALTVAGELAARHGIDIHTRVGAAERFPCGRSVHRSRWGWRGRVLRLVAGQGPEARRRRRGARLLLRRAVTGVGDLTDAQRETAAELEPRVSKAPRSGEAGSRNRPRWSYGGVYAFSERPRAGLPACRRKSLDSRFT